MKKSNLWWIAAGALALLTVPTVAAVRRDQEDNQALDPHLREKWRQAELWRLCNAAGAKPNDA